MYRFYAVFVLIAFQKCSAQEIFETAEAVVGHSAELPCNVTAELEDDKLNILAWYKDGASVAFYSRDLRGDDDAPTAPSGRYRMVSGSDGLDRLQIITVKPADAGVYMCLVDFAASPTHKTFVRLNVIEPPRHLWVVHENGTQVAKASAGVNVSQNIGPYYVGDTVHLFCVAFGGKPQASLSWYMEQHLLKDTSTPLSEHRVRSDIKYGPLQSEDHGRVLTCFAKNNDKTPPLSIDVLIDMFLPPELVSLRLEGHEGGRVKAGDTLNVQCRVFGARPTAAIVWRLDDNQLVNLEQNVTIEASQRLVISDVQLTITREYDEAALSCCAPAHARGAAQYVCADKLPLTVLYRPALEIVTEVDLEENNTLVVTKGSDVRMACTFQANPAVYQLTWFHEDDILGGRNNEVQAILELTSITESDAGEYVCAATNDEGSSYSEPVVVNVTYPAYCEEDSIAEYGLGANEALNLTCNVEANPEPTSYRWAVVDGQVDVAALKNMSYTTLDTEGNVLLYERPNSTTYSTVFCWGQNNVESKHVAQVPCTFLVSDETMPRPLSACAAIKRTATDILVTCEKGHDGGLPQKFKFTVVSGDPEDSLLSITAMEPEFVIPEPKREQYKFVVVAYNDKGESKPVEIAKHEIIDKSEVPEVAASAVGDITTLALALCGGVLLVALAACGLVLCAHERGSRPQLPIAPDPPLCAYNTEESNCETYVSEDGSECGVRRAESFRRAVSRCPSRNFDVRRTSSFHATRHDDTDRSFHARHEEVERCGERHSCRVHSLQNIARRREPDCDHFVLRLPPDAGYNVPTPMNTFYTMPRKSRQKMAREISDEASVITQTSDGFSLPPPPDEFGTYRAATRIRDIPTKATPTYTTIRKNNTEQPRQQYSNVMSPMNTVGIPTVSAHNSLYTYPDEQTGHGHQVNTNPFDEDSS